MRVLFFQHCRKLYFAQEGGIAIITAVSMIVLVPLLFVTIDMGQTQLVHAKLQRTMDTAALAAVKSARNGNVEETFNNYFLHNYSFNGAEGADNAENSRVNLDKVRITQDTATGYTFCRNARVRNFFTSLNGQSVNYPVCSTVKNEFANLELSLILDSGGEMNNVVSGGKDTRLQAMKNAATTMVNAIFNGSDIQDGTRVSVVSYGDSVKVHQGPNTNQWLRLPYPNSADHNGCMATRGNGFDYQEEPPIPGDINRRFRRYTGPFDVNNVKNKIKVNSYAPNPTSTAAARNPNMDYVYPMAYDIINPDDERTPDANQKGLKIVFPDTYKDSNPFPVPSGTNANNYIGAGGRFSNELDYLWNDRYGNVINRGERLEINYGADYVNAITEFKVRFKGLNDPSNEYAKISVYSSVTGASLGETYPILGKGGPAYYLDPKDYGFTYDSSKPFGKIVLEPLDSGMPADHTNRFASCASPSNGAILPLSDCLAITCNAIQYKLNHNLCGDGSCNQGYFNRNFVSGTECYRKDASGASSAMSDNSDFIVQEFRYQPNCIQKESFYLMDNRLDILNKINGLMAGGPVRNNIGMQWGWFGLSPLWKNIISNEPSAQNQPTSYGSGRKIAVLLTQGKNLDPAQDDAKFLQICSNMKSQGIEIYTVSFDVKDPVVKNNLANCATGASYYYNTTSQSELQTAFTKIGNSISIPKVKK